MTSIKSLSTPLLVSAYANGLFPMPEPETGEILWYQPDPRAIIPLDKFHLSKSLQKTIRKHKWTYTVDQEFAAVMDGCADRDETWINQEMHQAYCQMHVDGFAMSIEVRENGELIGGTYGVLIQKAFFAESKFRRKNDASKAAIYFLVQELTKRKVELLEVQFITEHLRSLGAVEISLDQYMTTLESLIDLQQLQSS